MNMSTINTQPITLKKKQNEEIKQIYERIKVVTKIPSRLFCFRCKKETPVKRKSLIERIKQKFIRRGKRPACKLCGTRFSVVKVKVPQVTAMSYLRIMCKKAMKNMYNFLSAVMTN